jgi:hypothetical protein
LMLERARVELDRLNSLVVKATGEVRRREYALAAVESLLDQSGDVVHVERVREALKLPGKDPS